MLGTLLFDIMTLKSDTEVKAMSYFMFAIALFAVTIFILVEVRHQSLRALFFKIVASFSFIALFVVVFQEKTHMSDSIYYLGGAFNPYIPYMLLFGLGLVAGLIGDIVLGLRPLLPKSDNHTLILSGIVAFSVGHILYYLALVWMNRFSFTPFIITIGVSAVVFFGAKTLKIEWGKLMIPCMAYSFLIFLMVGQSIVNAMDRGFDIFSIMIFTGAVLFGISDLILSQIYFKPHHRPIHVITNLSSYYLAQLFLAFAFLFVV